MNYKKKIYWVLVISAILILISLVLGLPENFGLCKKGDISCVHNYIDNFNEIIQITFIFSIPVIIISLVLLFLKEKAFKAWSKFAIIFIPISIILISITPSVKRTLIGFDREIITIGLAIIFFTVSLLIIVVNSARFKV